MIPIEIRQLMDHMEWADALVWSAALGLPAAGTDARLRELLTHVHTVQWAYLQIWRGEAVVIPELESFADPGAVCRWAREYYAQVKPFLAGVSAADLERHVQFPWAQGLVERFGEVHPTTVRQALLQIPSHSTYHRGQVNTRIRELGGEPPLTDFVAWVWRGEPSPAWPEATT